jgi:hypothetical protein
VQPPGISIGYGRRRFRHGAARPGHDLSRQHADIWDGLTDALYSTHKLIGFLLLWLVAGPA